MGEAVPSQLRITLGAQPPLARAGLEHAAAVAGFVVLPGGCTSVASLRIEDAGRPHPHVDVGTDGTTVIVTLKAQPSFELWEALFRLVSDLLGQH